MHCMHPIVTYDYNMEDYSEVRSLANLYSFPMHSENEFCEAKEAGGIYTTLLTSEKSGVLAQSEH